MKHKLIVFGGQGRTGQEVVLRALRAGYKVTAFVHRDNGSLPAHKNLRIIEGNARDGLAVDSAITGHDVVINIIAPHLHDSKNYDISVEATKNILIAMKRQGITRYWGQCGAWATDHLHDASLPMQLGFKIFRPFRLIYKFKKHEDELVKKSGLNWTIVRAPVLTNGPLKWPVRMFFDSYKCKFYEIPRISRKSVAKFYIENLDSPELINKFIVILK
ncbi:MAG: NAD(P)H-binding protein [Candidatus Saccharimonadales bacterium]